MRSSVLCRYGLAVRLLPFSFTPLHLFFRDGEHLADGVIEAFGFGVAGDCGGVGFSYRSQYSATLSIVLHRLVLIPKHESNPMV